MSLIALAENRWLPDSLIRFGMRRLLRDRLNQENKSTNGNYEQAIDHFAATQRESVVTIETHRANEQHYEVPAKFFQSVLGSRLKYSGGLWESSSTSLDESEEAMLRLSCKRAGLEDGMRVLELGCGWGSLTMWIAENFPQSRVTALSNSASQRAFIESQCRKKGLENVDVITTDVGTFDTAESFDRVMSVEMFEHVRNHEDLLSRVSNWLDPGGQLFVHVFCHRNLAYTFESEGESNWMGRHFFSGGMMPAENLFRRYDSDMTVTDQWWISGLHYAKTCRAWLNRLDEHPREAMKILESTESGDPAAVLVQRWRMFFMACEELFRFDGGNQWGVAHYVFDQARSPSSRSPAAHASAGSTNS